MLAVEELHESIETSLKLQSVSNRVAYFANDDDFSRFVGQEEAVNLDEIENFSL